MTPESSQIAVFDTFRVDLTREPISGTIGPDMGTPLFQDRLSSVLFGKTRQAVLGLLLSRPDESFYLREIVRLTDAGQGAVQRELGLLVDAGIVERSQRGKQVFFQANPRCPIFPELQGIMVKTAGIVNVLRNALNPLKPKIACAFVYGSMARGTQRAGSDIDLCVIGDVGFGEVVDCLAPAQEKLAREVNPTVYSREEFSAKLSDGHHFVTSLAKEDKFFVFGDENDFA